jgi:hypothetical protein
MWEYSTDKMRMHETCQLGILKGTDCVRDIGVGGRVINKSGKALRP